MHGPVPVCNDLPSAVSSIADNVPVVNKQRNMHFFTVYSDCLHQMRAASVMVTLLRQYHRPRGGKPLCISWHVLFA